MDKMDRKNKNNKDSQKGQVTPKNILKNLCTTTTLGNQKSCPLLTSDRCSEVGLCYEDQNWGSKMAVSVGRWSLFRGGP